MRVFVTGGTGTIGSAVVAELLGNGHTVLALARSDGSAQALGGAGAKALRGDLADLDVLPAGAAQCDGVISLAFGRDYSSPDALAQAIAEEGPLSLRWGRNSSGATARSSRSRVRPGCRGAPPPRPIRCRPKGRCAVEAVRSQHCWIQSACG